MDLAWHYTKYRMEQSEEDRLVYGFDEQEAELDDFHAVSGIARGRSGGAYTDPRTVLKTAAWIRVNCLVSGDDSSLSQ